MSWQGSADRTTVPVEDCEQVFEGDGEDLINRPCIVCERDDQEQLLLICDGYVQRPLTVLALRR